VAYNRTKLSTRGEDFAVLPLFSKAFDFISLSLPALYFPVIEFGLLSQINLKN
jgi:hypothetical protein